MLKKLVVFSMIAVGLLLMSGTAWADSVPIANASFEMLSNSPVTNCPIPNCFYINGPIPGWTNGTNSGSFQPGARFSSVPNGSIVAYASSGSFISQSLTGSSLLANSLYTLTVFVGNRTDPNRRDVYPLWIRSSMGHNDAVFLL